MFKPLIWSSLLLFHTSSLAALPPTNMYLASLLRQDIHQTEVVPDKLNCQDIFGDDTSKISTECGNISKVNSESNIIGLLNRVRESHNVCNKEVKEKKDAIQYFADGGTDISKATFALELDESESRDVESYLPIYTKLTRLQYESSDLIESLNYNVEFHILNPFVPEDVQLKSVQSLSCENLLYTAQFRQESDAKKYKLFINDTCSKLEMYHQCSLQYYDAEMDLRDTVISKLGYRSISSKLSHLKKLDPYIWKF